MILSRVQMTLTAAAASPEGCLVRLGTKLIDPREQMRKQVFDNGSIGNDMFGMCEPPSDSDIRQRTQGIGQAKSLLKSVSNEGRAVDLITSAFAPGITQAEQGLRHVGQGRRRGVERQAAHEDGLIREFVP